MNMTTIIMSGKHPKIVLNDASMLEIDESFGLIWIHPNGVEDENSYRLNLNMHMVDVHRTPQDFSNDNGEGELAKTPAPNAPDLTGERSKQTC